MVTTEPQIGPTIGQNSILSLAGGRSPPKELEVSPRSGPYLLVQNNYPTLSSEQWSMIKVGLDSLLVAELNKRQCNDDICRQSVYFCI